MSQTTTKLKHQARRARRRPSPFDVIPEADVAFWAGSSIQPPAEIFSSLLREGRTIQANGGTPAYTRNRATGRYTVSPR